MVAMQAAIARFKGCNPEELRELAGDLDELGRMAEKLRAGNMKAIGPLVGHVMRETRGRADGGEVTRLIRSQLGL